MCYTWVTTENGKVGNICQTKENISPGENWQKVPNDWNGNHGDKLAWFDADMRRIPDTDLIESGLRIDNRGVWYNKNSKETKNIYNLDEEPGEGWTKKKPIVNESYQKWDENTDSWLVDTEAKKQADKEHLIAEKKRAIQNAEQRIQRSLIAIQFGTATEEDQQYFNEISAEIVLLREELRQLIAA
jgi:hypothetical protein